MIHYAKLEHVPQNLEIPETWKNRFWYDEQRRSLVFDGVMYKSTFDRLHELSSDFAYQRALEELFRLAVPEDATAHKRLNKSAILAAVVFAAAACVACVATVLIWR